ncbi:hypothetical protein [Sorangium cellulosum]|uniref:Uncharacterized protein n=1 Tax=Sorangium cellulosum So0157-2 TaxID=1254432 RepID=S4XSE4_SORCE|nr:hypothetical protein [Sorangium cellulosum]AGP33503.1 hypothetical protein SCE1572_02670 [Sorangium cellulosum So0157-2]
MPDAEERLALAACAFLAGCLLLAPREWVSAGLALALAAALFAWHSRLRAGARRGGPAAATAAACAPVASAASAAPVAPVASAAPGLPVAARGSPDEAGAQALPGEERRESG